MKRYGYIYEKICTAENIGNAINKASENKKNRREVRRVMANKEECVKRIQRMLIARIYRPSPYRKKTIREGTQQKEREIRIPQFYPDQIIQWAALLQIAPYLNEGMDPFCLWIGSGPGNCLCEAIP